MDKKQFAANLSEARKSRNLTQKQVAEALGISDKTYSKWETGETEPGIELLCRLAAYYGLSPAAFFASEAAESGSPIRAGLKTLPASRALLRCREIMDEAFDGLRDNLQWAMEHADGPIPDPADQLEAPPAPEVPDAGCFDMAGALFLRHWGRDADLRLLLLPNESADGWLPEDAPDLSALFRACADTALLAFLLRSPREDYYTAEHLAAQCGMQPEAAAKSLDTLTDFGLCFRQHAELAQGPRDLYRQGDTRLLRGILTLAHLQLELKRRIETRRKEAQQG